MDYFSDGVTDDIVTELSRFRELFVIARNSSFSYKGKTAKVQDIAADLGVRYVLEGSVRAAGERIRITAQLVDAESGHHIWSERYDRQMPDLFALQDEIAHSVAGTVAGRLRLTAEERAERKPVTRLKAYDYALRATKLPAPQPQAFVALADVCVKMGRTDEARRTIARALGFLNAYRDKARELGKLDEQGPLYDRLEAALRAMLRQIRPPASGPTRSP